MIPLKCFECLVSKCYGNIAEVDSVTVMGALCSLRKTRIKSLIIVVHG